MIARVFTARRYATRYIYAVVLCLSVRHKPVLYRKEWKNRTGGFLPPITHCANWDISKDEAIPVWNLVSNSRLGKFRHGKSVALSSKLDVVVDGRVCWRHLYDSRRVVAVYYKSVNCNPPLLRFAVDLLYKMLTGTARRVFCWCTVDGMKCTTWIVRYRTRRGCCSDCHTPFCVYCSPTRGSCWSLSDIGIKQCYSHYCKCKVNRVSV